MLVPLVVLVPVVLQALVQELLPMLRHRLEVMVQALVMQVLPLTLVLKEVMVLMAHQELEQVLELLLPQLQEPTLLAQV